MRVIKDKVTWMNIEKPRHGDLELLKKQFRFHPIILDELLHTSSRSRVEFYKNYLYLTYHFPLYDKKLTISRRAEVDFLITKDTVITVSYESLEPLEAFTRILKSNARFKARAMGQTSAHLVYYLIQEIIHFSLGQLRPIEEGISFISEEIFKNKEEDMLKRISRVKRDVLDYRIINQPQGILLESFLQAGTKFWDEDIAIFLNDLNGDHSKLVQRLQNYHDTIESLENTNSQLLTAKANNVMQRFTILAFLTFPFVAFVSLFNIDIIAEQISDSFYKFWLGLIGVIGITIVIMIIFRKKGWL